MASPLSAWALGVGQIRVLSQRDQPLLAEIPIVSSDPTELEALQARLASPDTFARVGLSAPQGVVSDLQFAVALDARGNPVIRVTSPTPVQQPLLTFLVELDWGRGKLVREYSALIDTPQTAAAPVQPPIEEAAATASTTPDTAGTIVRAPDATPATPADTPADTPAAAQVASAPPPAAASTPTAVPVPPPAPDSAPAEAQPAAVAAAAPVQIPGGDAHVVKPGETLGGIANGLGRDFNLDQTIVALLRANPEAFIGGNANRLKAGAVLRIPDDAGIARYTPDEAALVVREQVAQWRGAGRALPQPPAVTGAADAPASAPGTTKPATAAAQRRTSAARLEIAPPSASDAKKAGTRSGVSAGGEGDMMRQQELQELQESRETLAARDAEVQELKARVAELEQLQKKQNDLISMKDSELAAAQHRLGQSQGQTARDAGAPVGLWLGIGSGLVILGLGAWWWLRRRSALASAAPAKPAPTERRRDTERLAAAIPKAVDADAMPAAAEHIAEDAVDGDASLPREPGWSRIAKPADPEPPKPASLRRTSVPTWHSGGVSVAPLASTPATTPAPAPAKTSTSTTAAPAASAQPATAAPAASSPADTPATGRMTKTTIPGSATSSSSVPGNLMSSSQGRLDLALAYLDMGDRETARGLLQEVATRGESVDLRREAERLLQELG